MQKNIKSLKKYKDKELSEVNVLEQVLIRHADPFQQCNAK